MRATTSRLGKLKRIVSQSTETNHDDNSSDSSEAPSHSKSARGQSLFRHLRNKTKAQPVEEVTVSRSPSNEQTQTAHFVKAFVKSLTASKVSNFFSWFLYYDTVTLPESPQRWFKSIPSMEMRGWIALGAFLGTGVQCGLDLLGWDAIRDRMQLGKMAENCLVQLGDPEKMSLTQLATVINAVERARKDEAESLKHVQAKLRDLLRLALRLKPVAGSTFSVWHQAAVCRLKDFLAEIIEPKLSELRGNCPVLTKRSAEERQQLLYLYEIMQQERQVPLIRYGIFPEPSLSFSLSTEAQGVDDTPPVLGQDLLDEDCQVERSFSSTSLKSENRLLRARNLQLEIDNRKLVESNEKLAKKVATIGRVQPALYDTPRRSGAASGAPPNFLPQKTTPVADEMAFSRSSFAKQPPPKFGIPRSNGRSFFPCFEDSSTVLSSAPFSPSLVARSVHSSECSEYQEVFRQFDEKPLSELRLTISETSDELPIQHSNGTNGDLVRSPAMYDLGEFRQVTLETPPTSSPPTRPGSGPPSAERSNPDSPVKAQSSKEPSHNNSLAEFQARQFNMVEVQRPITPYRQQSTVSRRLRTVRNAAEVRARMRTGDEEEVDEIPTETARKRGASIGRLLVAITPKKEKEEDVMDISQNF